MTENSISVVEKFKDRKILVVGDIMLDKYVWGKVTRISPEAPVQIVEVEKESFVPGGAANVANNISSLGATVYLVGIVGNDGAKEQLVTMLRRNNIETEFVTDLKKPTIQKVRIMGHNQQLLRVDYENTSNIDEVMENKVLEKLKKIIPQVDGVIISDYAKGIVTRRVARSTVDFARQQNKIVIVDPKPAHKEFYRDVTLITPNSKEAGEMAGIVEKSEEDLVRIGNKVMSDLNCNVLITRGEKGMSLFDMDGKIIDIPTKARQVYDVTGAGDTVTAIVAVALASGADLRTAAEIANHGAGIVVGKVGTATVTVDELRESIKNDH